MRYSTFFKFVAIVLCAASLLGMAGSATGIFFLTELGGRSVEAAYREQLSSRALGYTREAGSLYLSEHVGGAPRNLINNFFGNDWENGYFNWTRVGYTLSDSEGNVVSERPLPEGIRSQKYQFENAVSGQYMKVLNTYPVEKQEPQATEPGRMVSKVLVMPVQESTAVHYVIVDYNDGRREEWPNDGLQHGSLCYDGGNIVTFRSNIGELPMGDGWYPTHILFADSGGNIVYEAYDDTMVVQGSSLDGSAGMIEWYLPAGTVTMAAPVGTTYTEGEYTAYDAIPTQGATVTSMNVTYADEKGEAIGSEGIASPDLIGTIFHDHQGNAEFRSNEPMTIDIPQDGIITDITFADARQNCIFEASCPGGVGVIEYDRNGCLIFRGQMPGTQIPEETAPEATEAEAVPQVLSGRIGFAKEKLDLYAAPSQQSEILGTLEAWQEITVVRQDSFAGEAWGLTEAGWIRMDQVLLAEAAPSVAVHARMQTAEVPDAAPEAGMAQTEPTEATAAATEASEAEAVVAATETTDAEQYPGESVRTSIYYDGETQQDMVAEYVWERIPEGYTMTVRLADGALRSELGWTLLRVAEVFRNVLLEVLGISIAVFALCVVHLSCSAGRTRRNNEVRAGGLNRIPLDLYFLGGSAGIAGLVVAAVHGAEYFAKNDKQLALICCGACAYGASLLLVSFFFALVAQVKTPGGFWWRNSFCGRCMKLVIRGCTGAVRLGVKGWTQGTPLAKKASAGFWHSAKAVALWLWDTGKRLLYWLWEMTGRAFHWAGGHLARFFGLLPVTWQFLTTGFTLVFLLYIMMRTYKVGYILLGFGIFFAAILYAASAFAILLESAKRMSKGDLDTKVDDRMLIGGFKEFSEKLNDLADVAVMAAQKQLRSERMKTELITNVSHDIKTPLTSIINYVDLLQKPHTQEQQEQYLEVLDRQSHRLKKLVDDLMDMSKASSGNMPVDIQKMDAGETVNQVLGEFADKLERVQLTPVFRQPEEQVFMMADGRLVWRIMSNLLSNAVKYALPGTRIYLDLMQMEGKVIISMKNISREELNVSAEELLERFVRGDLSRNTEGSGLGLNIAQSLMELQKGQLQILVDGDLFKVTLIFPGA